MWSRRHLLRRGSRSFARVATLAGGARGRAARDAKADKPKRYEPPDRLQDRSRAAKLLCAARGTRHEFSLASALRCAHAGSTRSRATAPIHEPSRAGARQSHPATTTMLCDKRWGRTLAGSPAGMACAPKLPPSSSESGWPSHGTARHVKTTGSGRPAHGCGGRFGHSSNGSNSGADSRDEPFSI